MGETGDKHFDFEDWARLARSDPEGFERRRQAAIAELIAAAPPAVQRRLEGLQWQVDQVRARAGTPLAACLKLSTLLWDKVSGEHGLLESLDALARATEGETITRPVAPVVPLRRDRPRPKRPQ